MRNRHRPGLVRMPEMVMVPGSPNVLPSIGLEPLYDLFAFHDVYLYTPHQELVKKYGPAWEKQREGTGERRQVDNAKNTSPPPLRCDLAFTKKQGAFPAFSRKNTLLRPTIISCPVQSAKAIARKEILSLDCSPCRHLLSNRPRLRSSGRQPVHSPQPITSKNHPPFVLSCRRPPPRFRAIFIIEFSP